jgi:hypothetical protein
LLLLLVVVVVLLLQPTACHKQQRWLSVQLQQGSPPRM